MTYLNLALLATRKLVIALPDAARDVLPQFPALEVRHLLDGADGHFLLRRPYVGEGLAGIGVLGRLVPQAVVLLHRVRGARRGEDSLEEVGFGTDGEPEVAPALLGLVVDLFKAYEHDCMYRECIYAQATHRGKPARRALNVRKASELDVGRTVPDPIDTETWESDQELLLAATGEVDGEDGVANLLHDDATAGEASLLRTVALQDKTLRRVRDVVGGDGRVVRDLLDHQVCLSATIVVRPEAIEESTPR